MTYLYSEILPASVDPDDAEFARRVLTESCLQLGITWPVVRWYVASEVVGRHVLTKYGRRLDKEETRSLHGWYIDQPPHVAVRADQSRVQIGLTLAHELRHVWQEANDRPINEADAEAFAGRILASI